MGGLAAILSKSRGFNDVASVFTTHATLLGRYLCAGSGVDFYSHVRHFNIDEEAGKRGIYHRYCVERGAAHSAAVFTTVSHITAFEAEHLLGRRPDGVLPNGLLVSQRRKGMTRIQSKSVIRDFIHGHFSGHCDFDLEETLFFFTAGRFEFRNKGVDMLIESLARLNARLKEEGSRKTVVCFIIMPANTSSYNVEALKGQALSRKLKEASEEMGSDIGRRLYEKAIQ